MIYGPEHKELIRSLSKFIDQEINPYVDDWEAEGQFPAHDLFKKWEIKDSWEFASQKNLGEWGSIIPIV